MASQDPQEVLRERAHALAAFARYVARRFVANGGTETAAALTYTTLFAVVPFMTVTFSLLSAVPAFANVREAIEDFVFSIFVPSASQVVVDRLLQFTEQARGLTAIGTAFLVVTAFMMLVSMEKAFNRIWRVREARRGMSRFLLYWGVLTLSPLLIGLGFAVSSYLFSLPLIQGVDTFGMRENLLRLLPFLFSTGAFTVLYAAVPNTRVRVRHALLGGFVTMLAFETAKYGFAFFIKRSTVEVVYGTFAAVPLFLVWIYLTWSIVLVGAEIVAGLSVRRHDLARGRHEVFVTVLEFLFRVHRQHRAGGALPEAVARPVLEELGPDRLPDVLAALEAEDVVRRDADGNWLPGRDFTVLRLLDVHRALPATSLDAVTPEAGAPAWHRVLAQRLARLDTVREEALGLTLAELFAPTVDARGAPSAPTPLSEGGSLAEGDKRRA
jgi:membrane protein